MSSPGGSFYDIIYCMKNYGLVPQEAMPGIMYGDTLPVHNELDAVAEGGSIVMAAVMAGGMVPPLAIFLATRLFKNKFDKEQQDAGLTNIIMGLSFVTEGAIPFAAPDPLRAIPSFMIGSAVTGGFVGALSIRLMAPHGGIFVIPLVSNPLVYLLVIALGAVISGVIFGLLKKPLAAK